MKKVLILVAVVASLGMASCSSVRHTATSVPVTNVLGTQTGADLVVSPKKISYTFRPGSEHRRCGEQAVIQTAVSEALRTYGNADVLVGMQYEIKKTRNFFGHTSIKYVIVEGYPATYRNFQPVK